jgi:hypothetical protein
MDIHDIKNFKTLSSIIKKNDVLVDVGANMGDYTDFFKKNLDGTGKIYSIELSKNSFDVLVNKYKNDGNIIPLNYAVSNTNNMIPYYEGKHHCLNNILGHDVLFNENKKVGEIQSVRLDELLKDEKEINLIKIDVEGAEIMVLEGIRGIIDKINYILVECHLEKDWDNIKKLLLDDYQLECINNSGDVQINEKITKESKLAYQCLCKKTKHG